MNGYMWFHAARSLSAEHQRPQPKREPRRPRPEAMLGLLIVLATLVMTHAAMTG